MKQKSAWKWLMFFLLAIIIAGAFYSYKYRFYTPEPRIIFFDQQSNKELIKDNEWVKLLKDTYKKNDLETGKFNDRCFEFWLSNEDKNTIGIELHEYHQQGCPGDPHTSPLIDRFLINKETKIISWYFVIQNKVVGFEEYVKTVNKYK